MPATSNCPCLNKSDGRHGGKCPVPNNGSRGGALHGNAARRVEHSDWNGSGHFTVRRNRLSLAIVITPDGYRFRSSILGMRRAPARAARHRPVPTFPCQKTLAILISAERRL
jgi:hypothetical protein